MASTYALPLSSSSHAHAQTQHGPGHGHSRSYNYALLPIRSPAWPSIGNGTVSKKASSNSSLHNHALSLNNLRHDILSPDTDSSGISQISSRNHEDLILEEAMKGRPKQRPRGESDLGRPATVTRRQSTTANGYGFPAVPETAEASQSFLFSLPEALTAILVPLPYLLASLAYPELPHSGSSIALSPWNNYLQNWARKADESAASVNDSPFIQACTLSSGTLLLVGILARIGVSERVLDRRKTGLTSPRNAHKRQQGALGTAATQRILMRILSIALPYYAAMQLGGLRTALVLVTAIASGLTCTDKQSTKQTELETWKGTVQARKLTIAAMVLGMVCDVVGLTCRNDTRALVLGYLALAISITVLPTPLPTSGWSPLTSPRPASSTVTSAVPSTPWDTPPPIPRASSPRAVSPLICTPQDTNLTLIAGATLSLLTIATSIYLSRAPPISYSAIIYSTLSIASAAGSMFFAQPSSLRTRRKVGAAVACALTTCSGYLLHSNSLVAFLGNAAIVGLSYAGLLLNSISSTTVSAANGHNHKKHDSHHHKHHVHGDCSNITAYLVERCTPGSVLHSILIEKDSRRIAYFGVLNLAFMVVQFFYGFVSGSLGLLSDSIHMLFDCAGLAVGLAAAVLSKWPPSINFPYGYGKIDTLSGFANGIFLILVSVEIIFDALGRLREGHELRRLNELLVVSILGFLVNIVGLTAFGHAHHGHGHDHGHSHDHSHDHKQSSTPVMPPTPISATTPAPPPTHHEHHHHDHENENMRGIFLHIMADALGSAAVIFSTLLTKYYGWYGWDPLASCLIAILIFISAVPLVKSAGMRLLLTLPDDVEYSLRNTLQEISSLRGVVGYSVPRFWLEDAGAAHAHGHEHEHEHEHGHGHGHGHGHADHHCHDHGHGHEHEEEHESHVHEHQEHSHTGQKKILGVIHIIAAKSADLEDVRERTVQFLKGRGMDVVVHVEKEGEGRCWCGGGVRIGGP